MGYDDIGIVINIILIILKENGILLCFIGIDLNDGFFLGILIIMVSDIGCLEVLIKKLCIVKGVK